jgi:hypothetical protein
LRQRDNDALVWRFDGTGFRAILRHGSVCSMTVIVGVTKLEDLTIRFAYNGEVTLKDTQEILDKITGVHCQVLRAAQKTKNAQRRKSLKLFAENLARSFYGFEPDFFQQNVTRIVDDVVSVIQASLELWPTLVEICYLHKDKKDFPQLRVKNKRLTGRLAGNLESHRTPPFRIVPYIRDNHRLPS